jgi:hypothetical protein
MEPDSEAARPDTEAAPLELSRGQGTELSEAEIAEQRTLFQDLYVSSLVLKQDDCVRARGSVASRAEPAFFRQVFGLPVAPQAARGTRAERRGDLVSHRGALVPVLGGFCADRRRSWSARRLPRCVCLWRAILRLLGATIAGAACCGCWGCLYILLTPYQAPSTTCPSWILKVLVRYSLT